MIAREREVLAALADGLTNQELAERLNDAAGRAALIERHLDEWKSFANSWSRPGV